MADGRLAVTVDGYVIKPNWDAWLFVGFIAGILAVVYALGWLHAVLFGIPEWTTAASGPAAILEVGVLVTVIILVNAFLLAIIGAWLFEVEPVEGDDD